MLTVVVRNFTRPSISLVSQEAQHRLINRMLWAEPEMRSSSAMVLIALISMGVLPWSPACAGATTSCELSYAHVFGIGGIDENEAEILRMKEGDFFALPPKSPEATRDLNQKTLNDLASIPIAASTPQRKGALTAAEIDGLYQRVIQNDQVKSSLCGKYKGSDQYGFCFARAFAAHLMAIDSGLRASSIRKIWAVGYLQTAQTTWRYHVATLVRAEEGGWHAIDPFFDRPMAVQEWQAEMEKFSTPGAVRFFSSPASRGSPGSSKKYAKGRFAIEAFHGFYGDLINTLSIERTGKPTSWPKSKSELSYYFQEKIQPALEAGGLLSLVSVPTFLTVKAVYRFVTPSPLPSPSPKSRPVDSQ